MMIKEVYEAVLDAEQRLNNVIQRMGLIHSDFFSRESGDDVYIKPENFQTTSAFKIRGAYNKMSRLTKEERSRGVIAASAGNHSQGVAYAVDLLGTSATIVMPAQTPLIKVNSTRDYGAEVILFGETFDDAWHHALDLQKESGQVMVHPFNDLDIIAGQGTIGAEIL